MARIVIQNLRKSIEVTDLSKSMLFNIQQGGIDWMHACGGKGNCTTCKAIVLKGKEYMDQCTQAELRYKRLGLLNDNERLACQVRIIGDVIIQVPEESKLPHLTYNS